MTMLHEGGVPRLVQGQVEVALNDLLDMDLDEFNDYLSETVTGSIVGLTDIGWTIVSHTGDAVLLLVTGYPLDTEEED